MSDTIYSITIGGEKVLSETNTNPTRFEKVKVFSSSAWYTAASGFIRNLVIKNKNSGKSLIENQKQKITNALRLSIDGVLQVHTKPPIP